MSNASQVHAAVILAVAVREEPALCRAGPNLGPQPASEAAANEVGAAPAARCIIPGCVFPAWDPPTGRCHYHVVLDEEAELFQGCQPSRHVLAQALLGVPDPEIEEYRQQQKRMRAIVRELFLRGVA